MPELKEVFEMVSQKVEPDLDAWNQQDQRHRRAARNRRIGAFALVAAICLAAVVVMLETRPETAETTIGNETTISPVEVATRFVEAYGALDADRAISYLADDAKFSALSTWAGEADVDGVAELRLSMAWLDATGFELILDSCEEATTTVGSVVRCTYQQHALRSDQLGRDPYGPAYMDLVVRNGEVVRIPTVYWDYNAAFADEVWEPFANWVASMYPNDIDVMYGEDFEYALFSRRSIRLWESHLREYVEHLSNAG